MIEPLQNVPLTDYSTMRLGGTARYLLDVHSAEEIKQAIAWAESKNLRILMIGGGSNIIWSDNGYEGLVLVNKIKGIEIQEHGEQIYVTACAGEVWDSVVANMVERGFSGIEQLSLIPGSVGATPIQNVGAYGREIADVLVVVQAYDCTEKKMVVIPKVDCGFSYRTSRFKTTDRGRFLITSITMALSSAPPQPPFYGGIDTYLREQKIAERTAMTLRQAVIAIRTSKLPDPAVVANCGSFFANPIIPLYDLAELQNEFPTLPYWKVDDDHAKLSAAWMLESLGLKDYHDKNTGMATWKNHALVFVNEHAKSTASLLAFRDVIVREVEKRFNVKLEQEPELI